MVKCRVSTNAAHVSTMFSNNPLWRNELQRKKKQILQTVMLTYVAKRISSVNGETLNLTVIMLFLLFLLPALAAS